MNRIVVNETLATTQANAGDTVGQSGDKQGRTLVRSAAGVISVGVASTAVDFGANVSGFAKATPGNVFSFQVSSVNAAVRYFQLFEDLDGPVNAQVPKFSFIIPAGSATAPAILIIGTDFFTENGNYFATGISWGFSSVKGSYTAGTAADHMMQMQYV